MAQSADGAMLDDEQPVLSPRLSSFHGSLHRYRFSDATSSGGTDTSKKRVAREQTLHSPDEGTVLQAGRMAKGTAQKKKGKSQRKASKYAPPSKYAHLRPLTDILEPNLLLVFVGFNPGVSTAETGHAYAHKSNMFWKLLHRSGITERQLRPEEDVTLPRLYGMGNTNLVARPSRDTAELSREEQEASVPILDAKIRKHRPEAVCIVGKSIWDNIWKYRYGKKPSKTEFRYGWQDENRNMGLMSGEEDSRSDDGWKGSRVFVATATSGLAASTTPAEKEAIWRPLGVWVQQRRRDRAAMHLKT